MGAINIKVLVAINLMQSFILFFKVPLSAMERKPLPFSALANRLRSGPQWCAPLWPAWLPCSDHFDFLSIFVLKPQVNRDKLDRNSLD